MRFQYKAWWMVLPRPHLPQWRCCRQTGLFSGAAVSVFIQKPRHGLRHPDQCAGAVQQVHQKKHEYAAVRLPENRCGNPSPSAWGQCWARRIPIFDLGETQPHAAAVMAKMLMMIAPRAAVINAMVRNSPGMASSTGQFGNFTPFCMTKKSPISKGLLRWQPPRPRLSGR